MSRQVRRLRNGLMVAALVGGAVWAWYGANPMHRSGTHVGHRGASPAPQSEGRPPAIEPVQLHLIPRSQPAPLSPSFQPPQSPEQGRPQEHP